VRPSRLNPCQSAWVSRWQQRRRLLQQLTDDDVHQPSSPSVDKRPHSQYIHRCFRCLSGLSSLSSIPHREWRIIRLKLACFEIRRCSVSYHLWPLGTWSYDLVAETDMSIIGLHRIHKMWPIAIDDLFFSASVSVCLSVYHVAALCKNEWTDWGLVPVETLGELRRIVLDGRGGRWGKFTHSKV